MRRLLLMRHAKSDWSADFDGDHERPLNHRGVRSARIMGRMLAARGLAPHLVISSTAVRARTTAQLADQAGSWAARIELDRGLYESGPDGVIERASRAPLAGRLMLVGHQPTWSMLVERLTGESLMMKTASVAVVDFDIDSWAGIVGARGELKESHHPRSYFGTQWDRE